MRIERFVISLMVAMFVWGLIFSLMGILETLESQIAQIAFFVFSGLIMAIVYKSDWARSPRLWRAIGAFIAEFRKKDEGDE